MNPSHNICNRNKNTSNAGASSTSRSHAAIVCVRRRTAFRLAVRLVFTVAGSSVVGSNGFAGDQAPEASPVPAAAKSEFASTSKVGTASGEPAFADAVLPILKKTCINCHGPEKVKAGLRLDSFEGIKKGGDNGAVIKPGKAKASPLIQRLLLPLKHDDHMPPADKPQPTAEEIALLRRWVDAGAPGGGPAAAKFNPSVQTQPALASNQNAK